MSKQYHSFHNINLRENNKDQQHSQNVYCPFPIKKIEFDFAYNTLSSNGLPIITARADICNNEVVGVFNRYAGSSVLSAEITPANFNAARISNIGYIGLPGQMLVEYDAPGILSGGLDPGSVPIIIPNDWAAAEVKTSVPNISCNNNIRVKNNNPIEADEYVFLMNDNIFQAYQRGYIYITPAQLAAAAIPSTNNPLTTINNIVCTRQYITSGITVTTNARVTIAAFDARAISNLPFNIDMDNPPINITLNNVFNTINTSIPGNVRAYITKQQWLNAAIDSTNDPLTVNGPISCTLDGNALTLQVTQAEFNAAAIPNTNNPLLLPASMQVRLNGNANVNTLMTMDGLSRDKVIDYYYKDPIRVTTINYRFSVSPCVLIGADILCHVTCYG